MVGYPSSPDVLLRAPALSDVLRSVVDGKDSPGYALGQRAFDRAPAGADSHWANVTLAEFRHVGAKSRPFSPLSPKRTSTHFVIRERKSPDGINQAVPLTLALTTRCQRSSKPDTYNR